MLTPTLLILGLVLVALALAEAPVRRLPLTPAVVYLAVGWAGAAAAGGLPTARWMAHAEVLATVAEFALLSSLFAVGVRLRVPPDPRAWRVALWLAGPGMVVLIVLAAGVAYGLLALSWAAALLLAAVLAPTDPVLASDVQIRSERDRDAVRLSLTVEGGLNDGTALPAVMLALGLLGLHELGPSGRLWWWSDLLWPMGGGALLGIAVGLLLGQALRLRMDGGDPLVRDELIYVGAVAMAYGLARWLEVSTFVVAFGVGATLLIPAQRSQATAHDADLADRLHTFGARLERLVEALLVLAIGAALSGLSFRLQDWLFALLLLGVLRPLSVWLTVRPRMMPPAQRRLVAWFGIRGIGSVFYLLFALHHALDAHTASTLVHATLLCVAMSILLHGVSVTPLTRRRWRHHRARPAERP